MIRIIGSSVILQGGTVKSLGCGNTISMFRVGSGAIFNAAQLLASNMAEEPADPEGLKEAAESPDG